MSQNADGAKYIYYAAGDSLERIENYPKPSWWRKRLRILYLTDDIDEFALKVLHTYQEKEFKSVSGNDLGIEDQDKQEEKDQDEKVHQELLEKMKEILQDKVKEVRISKRLKSHPVCLTTEGEISIEMEKVLSAMPNNPNLKAEKILELNADHEVFRALLSAKENDEEKLALFTNLLYNQALLIEGLPIKDPVEFTNDICKLMA